MAEFFADEVGAGGDVAPLIGAADLELAVVGFAQVVEIVGLEQHVAELGVADAGVAFHAGANAVLRHHDVDGKIFPDVAQEIEVADAGGPIGVVDEARGIRGRREIEQARKLGGDAADVVRELLDGEKIALGGFS